MSTKQTPETTETGPVHVETLAGGAVWHVLLATPKANIIDLKTIRSLTSVFEKAAAAAGLKALLIEGEGPNFSFGASVAEHLPESCGEMITAFGDMFRRLHESGVPAFAAVRGQCLGGGLELASFCHRLFASPEAKLGQPEILLGVFAPVASVFLAERTGRPAAEEICLSGRALAADEAHRIGLVDEIAADPHEAALTYIREHILPRSASSLRHAARALRIGFARKLDDELAAVEKSYLEGLMATHDAAEGIRSFLEKRAPEWQNR